MEEIEYIARRHKIPEERLIYEAMLGRKVKDNHSDELDKLNREINTLLKEMFRMESEWAGLRYWVYLYIKENRGYAISLAGVLARNKNLRHLMKIEGKHNEISELVDKHLWM